MSTGASTIGMCNALQLIKFSMHSGTNLQALLKEVDYYHDVMLRFRHTLLLRYLLGFRETISTLIDKGERTGYKGNKDIIYEGDEGATESRDEMAMFINRTLQSFWCGYTQRCHHYATKAMDVQAGGEHNKLMLSFVSVMHCLRMMCCPPSLCSSYPVFCSVLCDQFISRRTE